MGTWEYRGYLGEEMGKKTKRLEEEEERGAEIEEEAEVREKVKKSRVSKKDKEIADVVDSKGNQENDGDMGTEDVNIKEKNDTDGDVLAAYQKKMGKVNPTRAERARRDNQRKMQAFVKVRLTDRQLA